MMEEPINVGHLLALITGGAVGLLCCIVCQYLYDLIKNKRGKI